MKSHDFIALKRQAVDALAASLTLRVVCGRQRHSLLGAAVCKGGDDSSDWRTPVVHSVTMQGAT